MIGEKMKYRSVQNLDEFIKTIGSVRAGKNIDEWKWQ